MARVSRAVAANICGVRPDTINVWVNRGHVIRHEDGYDVDQLLHWLDARDPRSLLARAGFPEADWDAILFAATRREHHEPLIPRV